MDGKATTQPRRTLLELVGDMAELVARAFLSGIAAAVAMSLAILALSATAQATTPNEAVVPGTSGNQPWSVAPAPDADRNAAGAGALWATPKIAGRRDEPAQTDAAATLQLVLGLLALLAAGIVAVVSRIEAAHDAMKAS